MNEESEEDMMFVAMRFLDRKDINYEVPGRPDIPEIPQPSIRGECGYLLVFETREEAKEAYPDGKIMAIGPDTSYKEKHDRT